MANDIDVAELRAARQHQALADRVIAGVARQDAEVALRAEDAVGESQVERVVDALVGIHGIVAPVLNQVDGGMPTRTGCESCGIRNEVTLRLLTSTRR